jgi:DNA replication protein DnaC
MTFTHPSSVSMEQGTMEQTIRAYCKLLSLPVVAQTYETIAMNATKAKSSYQEYLYKVLQEQVIARVDNSVNSRIKKARFPFLKALEEFDFRYQPQLDEKLIRELATLNFLKTAFNVLFIGPPGVGKTHLAVALGLKAASARKRTLFYTAEELVNELIAAEVSKHLAQFLDTLSRIDLLIIDELGYLQMTPPSAALFFRLIAKRYEKGSVIVTSNRPFEEWGNIFGDDVVAAAILDRLLHHSYPFLIQGKSYRMKEIFGQKKLEKKARVE